MNPIEELIVRAEMLRLSLILLVSIGIKEIMNRLFYGLGKQPSKEMQVPKA